MTLLLGNLLGISFQTELLIMTLLGLTNSTLDWKPFELAFRLNLIRDLHFTLSDVDLSSKFTSWIKKLLSITVVIEFFFGLVNPFAYLLKLYPIITWSRSDILLPWLVTHAVNTLLPKMLSVTLAFVFYSQSIITTKALMEFLVVETVNITVATYNWYVFFIFYLDLRELDRRRAMHKQRLKKLQVTQCAHSRSVDSIPNMMNLHRQNCDKAAQSLLITKSYTDFNTDDNQISSSEEFSNKNYNQLRDDRLRGRKAFLSKYSISSSEDDLSPAQKAMKLLKRKHGELEDAHTSKLNRELVNVNDAERGTQTLASPPGITKPRAETYLKSACTCSTSEEDENDDGENDRGLNLDSNAVACSVPGKYGESADFLDPSKIRVESPQEDCNRGTKCERLAIDTIKFSPTISVIFNNPRSFSMDHTDNLQILLNRNLQFLDRLFQTVKYDDNNSPSGNMHKWIIFRREFESNLGRNNFLKEFDSKNSNETVPIKAGTNDKEKSIKDGSSRDRFKIGPITFSNIENTGVHLSEKNPNKFNEVINQYLPLELPSRKNFEFLKEDVKSKEEQFNIDHILSDKKPVESYHTKTSLESSPLYIPKHKEDSSLKLMKPVVWMDHIENQNDVELRRLEAYNKITLVQDRRDMLQKKKKSKMTAYKESPAELSFRNSEVVQPNKLIMEERICKSAQSPKPVPMTNLNDYQRNSKLQKIEVQLSTGIGSNKTFEDNPNESNVLINLSPDNATAVNNVPLTNSTSKLNVREAINKIDWNIDPTLFKYSPTKTKAHSPGIKEEEPEARIIIDDETVGQLKSAFSFSDETERGFRLGPDAGEPYPVFQMVAVTMNEIFKATNWRNFEDVLQERFSQVSWADNDNGIYCKTENLAIDAGDNENLGVPYNTPAEESCDNKFEELEQRKTISAYLLDQLQEVLDSSRETLSVIEHLHDEVDSENLNTSDTKQILTSSVVECVTDLKQICGQAEHFQNDLEDLETYTCTVDEKPCSSAEKLIEIEKRPRTAQQNDTQIQKNIAKVQQTDVQKTTKNIHQNEIKPQNSDSKKALRKKRPSSKASLATKQGQDSPPNKIKEFDSEGRALTLIKSRNSGFSIKSDPKKNLKSKPSSAKSDRLDTVSKKSMKINSKPVIRPRTSENVRLKKNDKSLIDLFENFYQQAKKLEKTKEKMTKESCKKLAKTQNFVEFMSLFSQEDLTPIVNKSITKFNSKYERASCSRTKVPERHCILKSEIELKNSELQNYEKEKVKMHTISTNVCEKKISVQKNSQELPKRYLQTRLRNKIFFNDHSDVEGCSTD